MTYLSIIIPAYNEETRLRSSVEKILSFLDKKDYKSEVIVVDDGSSDGTSGSVADLVDKNLIRVLKNEQNRGKGFAVRQGVSAADGEFILFSDADLSTPIEEVDKLLRFLVEENYDIAIGSRALRDSRIIVRQPIYREYMGKAFNKIARFFTFRKIYDSQCGFKLFRREVAKKLFTLQKIDGFAFDAEVLFLAQKRGYKIKEAPVRWINNPDTKVRALSDSAKMFFELVKIRINYILRKYI